MGRGGADDIGTYHSAQGQQIDPAPNTAEALQANFNVSPDSWQMAARFHCSYRVGACDVSAAGALSRLNLGLPDPGRELRGHRTPRRARRSEPGGPDVGCGNKLVVRGTQSQAQDRNRFCAKPFQGG